MGCSKNEDTHNHTHTQTPNALFCCCCFVSFGLHFHLMCFPYALFPYILQPIQWKWHSCSGFQCRFYVRNESMWLHLFLSPFVYGSVHNFNQKLILPLRSHLNIGISCGRVERKLIRLHFEKWMGLLCVCVYCVCVFAWLVGVLSHFWKSSRYIFSIQKEKEEMKRNKKSTHSKHILYIAAQQILLS